MNVTVEMFVEHANGPAPGFGCFSPDDRQETIRFYAPVRNLLHEHAYNDTLRQFAKWIEDPGDHFREFYSVIDGALLYVDSRRETQGLHICSLSEWKFHTNQMKKRYVRDIDEFDGDIRFLTDSHVFACVPHSGNYFTVISSGPNSGKIYYVDHDDWNNEPFARSFNDFIIRIVDDPARFLMEIGCYARYSDGQTDTQWIPKRYVRDLRQIAR
jgi:hypothetical protein